MLETIYSQLNNIKNGRKASRDSGIQYTRLWRILNGLQEPRLDELIALEQAGFIEFHGASESCLRSKEKIETWRPVVGYEGLYEVSNKGRIKILERKIICKNGHTYIKREKIAKMQKNALNFYIYVGLSKNNIRKNVRVHRIVATAFLKKEKHKNYVNHLNGKKDDNRSENLEWCTSSENAIHAHKNNLINIAVGEGLPQAKLKEKEVIEIKKMLELKTSLVSIAKKYNVGISTIMDIKAKRTWKHLIVSHGSPGGCCSDMKQEIELEEWDLTASQD